MRGRLRSFVVYALAVLSVACSASSRHRVLTFFFDGVPSLEAPADVRSGRTAGGEVAKSVVRIQDHGPYAAKLCDSCHEVGRGNALVVPVDRLCARCHALDLSKEFVHGPLTAGGCILCHDPHRSAYPYLLVSESGASCLRCHERRSLRAVDGHDREEQPCTACHEAHMSDRRYLLR